MRKFGLLLLALAAPAFGTRAVAADLPPQMPVKAPVIAPFTWAGPYAGVNFGYSWGDWDTTIVIPAGFFSLSPDVDGWLGGVQIGRNWQRDQWVFGLEADIQITGEDDGFPAGTGGATGITGSNVEWDFPWFATLRARLGLAGGTEGRHLLYVTGGAAVGNVEFDFATVPAPPLAAISGDKTEWGWTLGGGWEYAYDDNWSVKLEYLYIDLGTVNFTGTGPSTASIDVKDHVVRIGLNYRWGDRPVVTRY